MKDNIIFFLIILALVALCVFSIINMFGGFEVIERFGSGSLAIGIIKIPFVLWGAFQVIRAMYTIIAKDLEFIAGNFMSDFSRNAAFVVDLVVSALGVYFLFQYWMTK